MDKIHPDTNQATITATEQFTLSHRKVETDWTPSQEPITAFIKRWSDTIPEEEAFIFLSAAGKGIVVTFRDLYEKSLLYANAFISLGVKQKDIVCMSMRSCPKWLFVHFGAMFMGAVPAPISFTYKDGSDVIATLNKIARCTAFVIDTGCDDNWPVFIRNIIDQCSSDGLMESKAVPSLKYLICTESPMDNNNVLLIDELLERPVGTYELPDLKSTDIAVLLQTSGSTALPKVVAHTHGSIVANLAKDIETCKRMKMKLFNDRPFQWLGGYPHGVVLGAPRVCPLRTGPQPTDVVGFVADCVKKERCNMIFALPSLVLELMARKELYEENWPPLALAITSQPIDKHFSSCIGSLCQALIVSYGSTEVLSGMVSMSVSESQMRPYCVGAPNVGSEVKVVDDNGDVVPVNTHGEMWMKSYGCFAGYLNDPERTEKVLTKDGWYKTDDVAYMSEDGLFFVLGRKSDLIISGGFNVMPSELEELLKAHQSVHDIVIVPIPDDKMYQVLCACVIPVAGSDVTEEALREYCQSFYNDAKRSFTVLPTYYLLMDCFPLTNTGKITRRQLTSDAILAIKK